MVYFREVQQFRQPWLWAILLAPMLLCGYGLYRQLVLGRPWGNHPLPSQGLLVVNALVLLMLGWLYAVRLVTEVREDELRVHFVLLWRSKKFPWRDIRSFRAVTYRPLADYGGWGIRRGLQGWAYNVSGNRGVEIELTNGERVLVGSQRPEELARAIEERAGRRG